MMRGRGALLARPHTINPMPGHELSNVDWVNAVERSLSFANASMKCAPMIHCFAITAPRCACARKADSCGRGPGYGSHIGSCVRGSPLLGPGAP